MSDDPASKHAFRWELRQRLTERLRIPWEGMGDMANQQRAEAAIQISTMMDEIESWRQAMQKAERDIAELRAERDAARREVCHTLALNRTSAPRNVESLLEDAHDIAAHRCWDCFKETP